METTQFNKYSIFIALGALLIALTAFVKEPIISAYKGERIDVSIERKLYPSGLLGRFVAIPFVTISNEGGNDIRLGEVSLDIAFENGKKTILKADTYEPITSNAGYSLPLRDVLLRQGSTWSGRVVLKEQLASNEEEMRDKLFAEARTSAQETQANYNKKLVELQGKIIDHISQPKGVVSASLLLTGMQSPDRFDPSDEILQRARTIFEKNISHIATGDHSATLTVFSASEKVLYKKIFRFTLNENHISNLRASFDGYGATYIKPKEYLSPFSFTLKDMK